MRCPNCGTENAATAAFCSRCGTALPTAVQPPAATPPPGATPPPAAPPPGGVPAAPPPGAPPGFPGATPPGGPGGRKPIHPAVHGAILGVGILAVGLIVWFAFLRDDDGPVSAAPSASTSVGPDAATATTTGATGPTGATGATETTTGATGPTGATAGSGISVFVEVCESVDDALNCVNAAPYDPATGWSVSQDYETVEIKLTTENLQPGDVMSLHVVEQSSGEVFADVTFDAAPAEVVDYEQWIYSAIPVSKGDPAQPWETESYEFTVSHNGEVLSFDGPNVFTFLP